MDHINYMHESPLTQQNEQPPLISNHWKKEKQLVSVEIIKDDLTVGCPIFPPILIAKYLFTGSLKKIDQLIFRNAKEIYFNEKFDGTF